MDGVADVLTGRVFRNTLMVTMEARGATQQSHLAEKIALAASGNLLRNVLH